MACTPNLPARQLPRPSDHRECPHFPWSQYHQDAAKKIFAPLIIHCYNNCLSHLTVFSYNKIWTGSSQRPLSGCYVVRTAPSTPQSSFPISYIHSRLKRSCENTTIHFLVWEIYVKTTAQVSLDLHGRSVFIQMSHIVLQKQRKDIHFLRYIKLMSAQLNNQSLPTNNSKWMQKLCSLLQ